jgi:transcription-repair coupling factor (superfamily II helicase)
MDEMTTTHEELSEGGAQTLLGKIRRHPGVVDVIRSIRDGDKRLHVTGLRGASIVFFMEAVRETLGRPLVICCPDEEQARDVWSDLRTISGADAALFPEKDIFPQRYEMRENLAVRGGRTNCLNRILQHQAQTVVTSVLGFLEKTYPLEVFQAARHPLQTGDTLDLDVLRRYLMRSGYEFSPIVEEMGQFAVRGAIVDIFDPSWERPARIELMDEEICSLRTFDIDSQCSVEMIDSITVLPATSVPSDTMPVAQLRERLAQIPVDNDNIDRIVDDIAHSRQSYLLRRYAPALGMNGTVLDYFDTPPLLLFVDAETLASSFAAVEKEIALLAKKPDDGFPLLDLFEYLHRPDYFERYDSPTVFARGMPAHDDDTPTHDSNPHDDEKRNRFQFMKVHPGEKQVRFRTESHPSVVGKRNVLSTTIRRLRGKGLNIYIYSESAAQRERLADMLDEDEALVHLPVGWISGGFVWEEIATAILTDHEIYHRILPRPKRTIKRRRYKGLKQEHLQLGDFVVHLDYGIGRFMGLEKVEVTGKETECLILRYLGGDRIYVPLEQMHLVEKYVGKDGTVPSIDRLGSLKWQRTKERTKKALEETARELLNIYAKREVVEGRAFDSDSQWQLELEAAFPFEETPHQLEATAEVKNDMETPQPMDRLICGDVGYGKTEVAIRAAFKAVNDGMQAAVLVPTTILAMQHLKTFQERMGAFPVRVEMLSRFKTPAEQKKTIRLLADGVVDVVIGTHRLLSKDIDFKRLGLVIVDEEHRFGVRSKEKLKRMKQSVDVLSLTATPIPRTLYMALSGIRKISVIDTPPRNRHPVKTEVIPFDEDVIAEAIMDEVGRGGQVFFVHNRVASIYSMQAFLEKLLPGVRFGVAHGQMRERELEKVILSFLEKKFDVLLSTMIIESGLDFANVDTIIINRADRFGLAQLYQLRGRVGRRERQARAYLLFPRYLSLTETARKRLQAMEEFEELGSGYRLAMRDLEIRGAGNVLGVEQHGRMVAVGFDLYCKMLKEAVGKIKGEAEQPAAQCKIEVTLNSFLPDWYVEDQDERMSLYKRLGGCRDLDELTSIQAEMIDRFGELPPEALNLIEVTQVKLMGMALGVERIHTSGLGAHIEFLQGRSLAPGQCAGLAETFGEGLLFKSGRVFSLSIEAETIHRVASEKDGYDAGITRDALGFAVVKKLLIFAYSSDKKGNSHSPTKFGNN